MSAAGAQRTVKAVVTTYIGPDDVPRVGLRGERVTVGAKHVDAFDASDKVHDDPARIPGAADADSAR